VNDGFDAPPDPRCAYGLPHYRWLLQQAQAKYWLPLVRDIARGVPDRALLLVRHDVDITPWSALRMAQLEHQLGVHTTYYYRLHAPFYNLMDATVLDTVREVAAMGHEVGLHYEPGFFLDRGMDPVVGTRNDLRTFEDLVGFRTHSIAQHQPAQGPVLADISERHPCAYQPALVRDMPYFGDSGFHWREGCICTKFDRRQLHVLIHPHSWVRDERPWQDVLRAHAADLANRLHGEMAAYVTHVEGYLARRAELDRERERRYRG